MSKDLSDEDKALFRRAVIGVKQLKHKKNSRVVTTYTLSGRTKPSAPSLCEVSNPPASTAIDPSKSQRSSLPSNNLKTQSIYLSDYYTEVVQAESVLSYHCDGMSAKRFQALKQGEIPWEATLDLHGLTADLARQELMAFIFKQYKLARRCLLIIHGKGAQRQEPPILKNLVNHWLRQFPHVIAFHSALPRHGGAGVLYVLLKRHISI